MKVNSHPKKNEARAIIKAKSDPDCPPRAVTKLTSDDFLSVIARLLYCKLHWEDGGVEEMR